ncbi:SH3 domain-containing protein [Aquamicrobium sp. LC103]|uniref:SH3 domain-containing protein n=1 Tax=Aquamicrobium sp. LC103 TaxID=1120658 RepID=UPI00063E74E9|nr:SH3 domain-containing protein [Aquamicrobium sp. LC103]TKT75467.1 hypothetical protein XW59_020315 [Aquamicrobium sp. LC103]
MSSYWHNLKPDARDRWRTLALPAAISLFGVAAIVTLVALTLSGGNPPSATVEAQPARTADTSAAEVIAIDATAAEAETLPRVATPETAAPDAGNAMRAPAGNDPRWGDEAEATAEAPAASGPQAAEEDQSAIQEQLVEAARAKLNGDPAAQAGLNRDATASIGADVSALTEEDVEVAETAEEIAALEAAQRSQADEMSALEPSAPQSEAVPPPEAAAEPDFTNISLSPATVGRYVNLRSGPADEAEVLLVVPANAVIEAARDCNWCEAVYQGRRGYIYRSFISYPDQASAGETAPSAARTAPTAAVPAPEPRPTPTISGAPPRESER